MRLSVMRVRGPARLKRPPGPVTSAGDEDASQVRDTAGRLGGQDVISCPRGCPGGFNYISCICDLELTPFYCQRWVCVTLTEARAAVITPRLTLKDVPEDAQRRAAEASRC